MQVILDSPFARPGSAPIGGRKKREFRDWTRRNTSSGFSGCGVSVIASTLCRSGVRPFDVRTYIFYYHFPEEHVQEKELPYTSIQISRG